MHTVAANPAAYCDFFVPERPPLRYHAPMYVRIVLFIVCLLAATAHAAEVDGQSIALQCTGCHGTDGNSQGKTPELTGKAYDQLARALKKFGAGRKHPTMMDRVVRSYTWAELKAAAEYFASLDEFARD